MTEEDLSKRLQRYLAQRIPGAAISGFQFLTNGFESEVFSFNLHLPTEVTQPMILRLYPGQGAEQKMTREAKGLIRLRQDSYPVPAMLLYENGISSLGHPFSILQKLEGRSLWPVLAEAEPDRAEQLLSRFGNLIAHLHRLDWRAYTERTELYEAHPELLLKELWSPLRQLYLQFEVKGCLAILDWLVGQRSRIRLQPAVVHLDLHANNVFLLDDEPEEPRERMAVIDWTQIAVCDYRVDLSWTLMIMGDYGSPAWAESIRGAYQVAAGHPLEDLDYFFVFAYTKLLGSTVISLKADPKEVGLRPETAASPQEQSPTLLRLSRRIRELTGLRLPEVDAVLSQAGLGE